MKINEIIYITHCEEPTCDLGASHFNCPNCSKLNIDYGELWWERDEISNGKKLLIKCEECNCELIASYSKTEYIYTIQKNN